MQAILVDDDFVSRTMLATMIKETKWVSLVAEFDNAEDALTYAENNQVDLAILDIQLPKMDGMELAKQLRVLNSDVLFMFETGREEYALPAFQLKALAYITKPYQKEDVAYALETAYLLSKRKNLNSRYYARTFGYFDFFIDGEPIVFKSAKAKELLALLVDRRGGIVTSEQMIATLWEDRPNDDATQNLASKLTKTLYKELENVNAQEILHIGRGFRNINVDKIDCDLYAALDGKVNAMRHYCGEYMNEYSWGEYRVPVLDRIWNEDYLTK